MAASDDGDDCIYSLSFMDGAGTRVYDYNAGMSFDKSTQHALKANEQLIGVYGVKDKFDTISSFGFLVKVK